MPLIVGGGPAGAAMAIHLARAGREAIVLERSDGPADKVCGDFLSAEAVAALAGLGVDLPALGALPISRLRLVQRRRVIETALPFSAMALSRRALDEALLQRASALGATVHRGQAVREIAPAGNALRVRLADPDARTLVTDSVFLATGKHDLRGAARPAQKGGPIGLKTYLRLAPDQQTELGGHVELVLFRGGYIGLQSVEDSAVTLCAVVERDRFTAAGNSWQELLHQLSADCPHLDARLEGALALRERPQAVAGIPYGYLHRSASSDLPHLFRLGDQACVIPSCTGDGVAIALHSAAMAAEAWCAGLDAAAHHRRLAASLRQQMRLAGALHRLCLGPAQSWIAALGQCAPVLLRQAAAWTRLRT